jgi:hypothetical protein
VRLRQRARARDAYRAAGPSTRYASSSVIRLRTVAMPIAWRTVSVAILALMKPAKCLLIHTPVADDVRDLI